MDLLAACFPSNILNPRLISDTRPLGTPDDERFFFNKLFKNNLALWNGLSCNDKIFPDSLTHNNLFLRFFAIKLSDSFLLKTSGPFFIMNFSIFGERNKKIIAASDFSSVTEDLRNTSKPASSSWPEMAVVARFT